MDHVYLLASWYLCRTSNNYELYASTSNKNFFSWLATCRVKAINRIYRLCVDNGKTWTCGLLIHCKGGKSGCSKTRICEILKIHQKLGTKCISMIFFWEN